MERHDLFRLCFKSLSFKRHYSSLLRRGILTLVGLAVFLLGYFLWHSMPVYITGAVLTGAFLFSLIYELVVLLIFAIRSKKHGLVVAAVPTSFEKIGGSNRYRMDLEVTLPDGNIKKTISEGPLWLIDTRAMNGRRIKVIFTDDRHPAILLP